MCYNVPSNQTRYRTDALRGRLSRSKYMLEVQHISFVAADGDTDKEILDDVSFCVDEPFVAITGPNGSGKSTLAKIIAGILTRSEEHTSELQSRI